MSCILEKVVFTFVWLKLKISSTSMSKKISKWYNSLKTSIIKKLLGLEGLKLEYIQQHKGDECIMLDKFCLIFVNKWLFYNTSSQAHYKNLNRIKGCLIFGHRGGGWCTYQKNKKNMYIYFLKTFFSYKK